jgi:hypothetical protein
MNSEKTDAVKASGKARIAANKHRRSNPFLTHDPEAFPKQSRSCYMPHKGRKQLKKEASQ